MDNTAFLRLFLVLLLLLSGCAGPAARTAEKPAMIYGTVAGRMVGNDVYSLREQ